MTPTLPDSDDTPRPVPPLPVAFIARVRDAIARLKAGESRIAVRERHGACVLREAERKRHAGTL